MPACRLHIRNVKGISYKAMIQLLEQADHENGKTTVSLKYIKCNRRKKTGGQIVTVERAQKCGLPYHCADNEMRGIIDEAGKKTAVHLRLILEINGQPVYP